jgi:PQQ-dependent dehydrogenase (s-GDH family)
MKNQLQPELELSLFASLNIHLGKFIQLACLLVLPFLSFSQSYVGTASNVTDGGNVVGPTAALTPPASMQAGDLVIVYAQHRATGATLTMSTNTGQIWSTVTSVNNANNQSFFIFSCRYNGSWTNNPVISGGSGTVQLTAAMYVFRPSNANKGWTVNLGPTNTTGGTNPNTIAGGTTTIARTVSMAFWGSAGNNSWGTFSGTNWTKGTLPAQIRNAGTNSQSLSAAYQIRTSTGGTNSVTQTQSATTTANKTFISWGEVDRPSNDDFANAITINSSTSCVANSSSFTGQTLTYATAQGPGVTPSCGSSTAQDVWYKFVAKTKTPTIAVSGVGSSLSTPFRMQILTGTYGSFTEISCGSSTTFTPALTAPLTPGTTYYIRIHKNTTTEPTGSNWGFNICVTDALDRGGRMNEVFSRTVLSAASVLNYPWEVAYGADNNLWVTESKGYKVYKIDPNTGAKTTVLDISQFSSTAPDNSFRCQFNNGAGAQGGLAGLALHPNFLDGTADEKNYVYISYIYSQQSASYFTNRLVRFTYDKNTQRLISPISICDTLPGSNDHNSQRVFIAPLVKNGPQYLFYASGDMGAGQGSATNIQRPIRSQIPASYEGKILRFNLDYADDADAVMSDRWIPNDNPYNAIVGKQNAVWAIGIRNNQGFAYDSTTNKIYGASHGAYSDDEINVLEGFTHYGHPYIIGYADGNYDGNTNPGTVSNNLNISAGAPYKSGNTTYGNGSCPPIGSEVTRKNEINAAGYGPYRDPLYSGYPGPKAHGTGSVRDIWQNTNGANGGWPSEGWSGLDIYMDKIIPGWYRSLIASGLKWGRLIRVKLNATGDSTIRGAELGYDNFTDSITYFQSSNRYRDIAFGPNGKDIYVVMDNSSATSGPGTNNPMSPACAGCLVKYTFLGYADNGGKSSIPTNVDVTKGVANSCNTGTTVTIDGTNNYLWVPITGPDGNIMAEINAMGQNLGTITSSFYVHGGPVRSKKGYYYLNRNITITPSNNSFSTPVKIRLYITKEEFDALDNHPASGITAGIGQLKMMKNNDPCGPSIISSTEAVAVTNTGLDLVHGANGYVLQGEVTGFSTFYFGASNMSTLPLDLITFKGTLQNNATLLQWETDNEKNTSHFGIERSTDGRNFDAIGSVTANNNGIENKYAFVDNEVTLLPATVIYYRLKMVDAGGQFTYSNVVTISLNDISGKIVLSPNPAKHETKVTITSASTGKAKWKLTDNTGRVVMQDVIYLNRGNNNMVINLNSLGSGLYYLNVSGAGIEQNVKLQKL